MDADYPPEGVNFPRRSTAQTVDSHRKPASTAQTAGLAGTAQTVGLDGNYHAFAAGDAPYMGTWGELKDSIARLSRADTKNVQQIAASQLELLSAYHQVALAQSSRSFFWALIGSGLGLLLFAVAVAFSLLNGLSLASLVPLIAGGIVQVVSGVVFYLYGKSSSQLSAFHSRLEVLQRYLLANSICESLEGEARSAARAALIQEISRAQPLTS